MFHDTKLNTTTKNYNTELTGGDAMAFDTER
jgi:hypothetical protein